MFTRKNALISLAVAVLLAGCGGGGGGGTPATTAGTSTNTGNTDNTGNTGNTGNTSISVAPTTDPKLAATVTLENVVFKNDADLIQIAYNDFHSNVPRDATVNPPTAASSFGAFGFAKGTNAPLQAIGYQIGIDNTAADSKTGRLAFELQDEAGVTPQEVLRIEIDKLTFAVDATGGPTVTVPTDAKVYVFAKGAAGQATVSAPATADMLSIANVGPAASGVEAVMFNVDAAVGAAVNAPGISAADKAVMSSVKDFGSGVQKPFEVTLLFSNLDISLPPATGATTGTPLTGKADGKGITVDNAKTASGAALPGVLGGGATGFVQVDEPTPAP